MSRAKSNLASHSLRWGVAASFGVNCIGGHRQTFCAFNKASARRLRLNYESNSMRKKRGDLRETTRLV